MPDFPIPRWPVLNTIHPWSMESSGMHLKGAGIEAIDLVTGTPEAANTAYYWPFMIFETSIAVKMSYIVGTTPAGNVDVGIYDAGKNRLVNSGSTAQGSASTLQEIDITDTTLTPGQYFMAIQFSSGSANFFRFAIADETVQACVPMYVEAVGSFGLPATAAWANSTNASPQVPSLAVHFDTLV